MTGVKPVNGTPLYYVRWINTEKIIIYTFVILFKVYKYLDSCMITKLCLSFFVLPNIMLPLLTGKFRFQHKNDYCSQIR
jgi:hypothetical protein